MAAGALHLSAVKRNADVAGNTDVPRVASQAPGAPAPTTVHELAASTGLLGEMESIYAGGLHPEDVLANLGSRALEVASSSLPGPHGGLVPRAGTSFQTGPAGTSIAARGNELLARLKALVT